MTTKTIRCLLFLLLLATHTLAQDIIRGRCVAVSDGDTIKVLATGRELLRIRVAWIDCPELGQAFGRRAKQFMSALVFGKDVELHPHAIDRYGRTVAMVFVDGRDVGLELIKAGLAWGYEYYLPEASPQIQAQYTAAETAARVSRKGLWVDGDSAVPQLRPIRRNRCQAALSGFSKTWEVIQKRKTE
jgi:endonuclease YncB( thermonuclease family)